MKQDFQFHIDRLFGLQLKKVKQKRFCNDKITILSPSGGEEHNSVNKQAGLAAVFFQKIITYPVVIVTYPVV